MTFKQKIQCNVNECEHNSSDGDTCTLDKIQVTPCGGKGTKTAEDETACAMYSYAHDSNEEKADKNMFI